MPTNRSIIRELPGLFQVRSGCTTFRYRPAFMFLLEGASKTLYLILVAIVSADDCGALSECVMNTKFGFKERCIVIMMITGTMYEIGEVSPNLSTNHNPNPNRLVRDHIFNILYDSYCNTTPSLSDD
jgi:hypothetical protein